ncbi:hypothetical protein FRB90_007853, partial [Tulasnella sp. 427]
MARLSLCPSDYKPNQTSISPSALWKIAASLFVLEELGVYINLNDQQHPLPRIQLDPKHRWFAFPSKLRILDLVASPLGEKHVISMAEVLFMMAPVSITLFWEGKENPSEITSQWEKVLEAYEMALR